MQKKTREELREVFSADGQGKDVVDAQDPGALRWFKKTY